MYAFFNRERKKILFWSCFLLLFFCIWFPNSTVFILFFVKGHENGTNVTVTVYFEFVIIAVCTLIFQHYRVTPLIFSSFGDQLKFERLRSASFIFVHPCFWQKKRRQALFTLLFLSSCSLSPSLLLAFFLHSLCPGSHYCFGKYFIGLNTFAHSHLPAASPLTHKPWIDRSK